MTGEQTTPSSWRDVYILVRDTHEDAMLAIGKVDDKVTAVTKVVDIIVGDRRDEKVAGETRAALATTRDKRLRALVSASRGTLALIISGLAVVAVLLK